MEKLTVFANDKQQAEGRRVLEQTIKQNIPSHQIKTVLSLLNALLLAAKNEGQRETLMKMPEIMGYEPCPVCLKEDCDPSCEAFEDGY